MRNGRGIAHTFVGLDAAYHFDAVVGHAAFGATLHLRDLTNAAIISYAELPGYQSVMARPEFPITFDTLLSSQSYKALLYASMMHSDVCVAPSEHAKRLLPSELQYKTRVQMEGFATVAYRAGHVLVVHDCDKPSNRGQWPIFRLEDFDKRAAGQRGFWALGPRLRNACRRLAGSSGKASSR